MHDYYTIMHVHVKNSLILILDVVDDPALLTRLNVALNTRFPELGIMKLMELFWLSGVTSIGPSI